MVGSSDPGGGPTTRPTARVLAAVLLVATAAVAATALPTAAALPTASLVVSPSPAEPGETVTLDATGSTGNGSVDGCRFDANGNGSYGAFQDDCLTTWTYAEAGTYNVSVQVLDGDWADTTARLLTVSEPPQLSLDYAPSGPRVGETVTVTANASDPDGGIAGYEWYVDGEVVPEATGATLEWTFASSGTHLVAVTVTDEAGHEVTREVELTVEATPTRTPTEPPAGENEPPTVELAGPSSDPVAGQSVGFEVSVDDVDGEVVSLTWRVDGERVDGNASLTWTFASPGPHEVSVVATDDDGATARDEVAVEVAPQETVGRTDSPGSDPVPDGAVPIAVGGLAVLGVAAAAAKLFGGGAGAAGGGGGGAEGGGGERGAEDRSDHDRDDDRDRDRDDDETTVRVRADGFDPVRTAVDRGTTVRWTNVDDAAHVVDPVRTTDAAADWVLDDADLEPGTTTTHEFDEPGVYEFRCPHCGREDACGAVLVGGAELDGTLPCEDGRR